MTSVFLPGPRLYLRPIEREDAPRIAAYINDPQVRRTLLAHRPMSVAEEQAFLEAREKDEHHVVLGIARQGQEELIGATGLHLLDFRSRRAELGLMIGDRSAWGQGFGTEATRLMLDYGFGTLNLHKVWLHVYAHHAPAIRVYEKAGFRKEGVQRDQHYVEGRYVDAVLMGIIRSEWTPLTLPSAAPEPAEG
ncbi:MAG: GNAT family N-acetyltransferase [Myxococcaceae bacterium]|nr:GNAT family N-acetyltransferase [Myxococcaceae bacterium]